MNTETTDTNSGARAHNVGDILRRSAARHGGKAAVLCGSVCWSYGELDAICNRLARGLSKLGVVKGDRVAILSRNSHSFVAIRFAVARIGGVLVPINFMLKSDEIHFILSSCGATFLGVGPDLVDVAKAAIGGTKVEHLFSMTAEEETEVVQAPIAFDDLLDIDDSPMMVSIDSQDVAQIIYTSGTESAPKGVMLSHGAVLWQYASCIIDGEMAANDLVLHALPLYHCAQLDVFLGPAIYLGSTNLIISKPLPDLILSLIATHKVTSFFAPPTIWIGMLRSKGFSPERLSSLIKGYYGASIMPVEVLLELQHSLPRVRFWNFYGQTEMAPLATVLAPEDQSRKPGSAGKPALNVETRVVDSGMRDVEPGEVGEIVHRSPQLMSGYYNDPEKTSAAFVGGWFHSGDLATIDEEGYISVVDRVNDMIKTGGENVASREVEEVVYRLPQVSEVAVVGVPDARWMEAVIAFVVLKGGHVLTEDAVIGHCRKAIAHFKAPKRVIFVDNLPKNPSGKVLKRDLRRSFVDSAASAVPGTAMRP